MAAGCLGLMVVSVSPESITLDTYYPAPTGIYTNMITTQQTILARDGGSVGIGTMRPQAELDVSGGIRIGNDTAVCAAANAGELRYNSGSIEFCNGSAWSPIAGTAPGTLGGYCDQNSGVAAYPATSCAQTCAAIGGTCGKYYVSSCAVGWTPFSSGGGLNSGSVTYTAFSSCIKNAVGSPPGCVPSCPSTLTCGSTRPDGCGGICTGTYCASGVCSGGVCGSRSLCPPPAPFCRFPQHATCCGPASGTSPATWYCTGGGVSCP